MKPRLYNYEVEETLNIKGKNYISAKRGSIITGYNSDYIGQLCRAKKIESILMGKAWYLVEADLLNHKIEKNKKSFTN